MIGEISARTRLCPHCANNIEETATQCSYCKADFLSGSVPKWLNRKEPAPEVRVDMNNQKKFPIPPKFVWSIGVLIVVLIAFFIGGYLQRSQLAAISDANSKQLQAKDQIIHGQQEQLAQVQKQLNDNANQLTGLKTKLEGSQKELSLTQQRLSAATREANRVNATRSVAYQRTGSRAPNTTRPYPVAAAPRPIAETGVYETTQATQVYENPSATARVITQIARGTRINVVNSTGDWLEVRSNRGNPPGYVRTGDARAIGRTNTETPQAARTARASASSIGSSRQ